MLISPGVDDRIAYGVQTKCNVIENAHYRRMYTCMVKTEARHDQQREDAEKANGNNNGESTSPFNFMLNGGDALDVVLFSDLSSVLVGDNENVDVRAKNDNQRDD